MQPTNKAEVTTQTGAGQKRGLDGGRASRGRDSTVKRGVKGASLQTGPIESASGCGRTGSRQERSGRQASRDRGNTGVRCRRRPPPPPSTTMMNAVRHRVIERGGHADAVTGTQVDTDDVREASNRRSPAQKKTGAQDTSPQGATSCQRRTCSRSVGGVWPSSSPPQQFEAVSPPPPPSWTMNAAKQQAESGHGWAANKKAARPQAGKPSW
jgi:hypothetical protein